jgi:hypothetical protein
VAELPHTPRRVFPVGEEIDSHPASAASGNNMDIPKKTTPLKTLRDFLI